ncbi:UDP-N-acetylmuramoyl-L-alanyl-D-glutamate--2,6-diaminopimelate ligase [Caminibacter profundus]
MDLIHYLNNDLITDNTKELTPSKLFLKTSQNSKYSFHIKHYITPKNLLSSLNLKTKFIGITGTNGKTTTAFVLGYLLRSQGFNVGVQGTEGFYFNEELVEDKTLTTPPILTTIKRAFKYKPDFFIMEVSSHAIVQNRIEGIDFFAKILTSFSQDHLDFHKTMDEYKKVKESFFQDETIKVVNGKIKSSQVSSSKFQVVEVGRYDFEINSKNLYVLEKPIIDDIPMAGKFNKMNFSLAIKLSEIISKKFNITWNLKLGTWNFKVPGRMEIVCKNPLIIIDFAHTPDGMEKVLSSVKGRKIVVFGAGGNRDKAKRPLMGAVAERQAEYIILTEDNPRCENRVVICEEIAKGIKSKKYEIITDRKKAIKKAIEIAKKENLILFVLGKGDEKYIEKCKEKIPFSDRNIIKNYI